MVGCLRAKHKLEFVPYIGRVDGVGVEAQTAI